MPVCSQKVQGVRENQGVVRQRGEEGAFDLLINSTSRCPCRIRNIILEPVPNTDKTQDYSTARTGSEQHEQCRPVLRDDRRTSLSLSPSLWLQTARLAVSV